MTSPSSLVDHYGSLAHPRIVVYTRHVALGRQGRHGWSDVWHTIEAVV